MTLIGRVGQSSAQAGELARRNAAHKAAANGRSDNTGISRIRREKSFTDSSFRGYLNRAPIGASRTPTGTGPRHRLQLSAVLDGSAPGRELLPAFGDGVEEAAERELRGPPHPRHPPAACRRGHLDVADRHGLRGDLSFMLRAAKGRGRMTRAPMEGGSL